MPVFLPVGSLGRVTSHNISGPAFGLRALIAAFVALLLMGVAAPASAHDELLGATPGIDSQVDALPAELVLTFSGVLLNEPGATEVVVTDADGASLLGGDPVLDGTTLTQPLEGTASGAVTVIWRVVSSDGHPISDQFSFTVGDGAAPAPNAGETPLPGPAMEDTGMGTLWIASGIAAVALIGALAVVLITRARRARED